MSQYRELLQQMLQQLSQYNNGNIVLAPSSAVNSVSSSVVNMTTSSPSLSAVSSSQPTSSLANTSSLQENVAGSFRPTDTLEYCYRVKLINPNKKSESIVRQLNCFTSKFESIQKIREMFRKQFDDQVPSSPEFALGYYDGSQQAKVWLYTTEDLSTMYSKYPKGGTINLWCDSNYGSGNGDSHKRKRGDAATEKSSHRMAKEEETEIIFKNLQGKHSAKYDVPRLRLWSRMIAAGIHDDYDKPPDIPAFSSKNKRARKETMSDCISGAAVAIVEALQDKGKTTAVSTAPVSTGISPIKCIDLRMKNFEQLRYLQSLLDDGILSETEYAEQKTCILDSLKKLQ